MVGNPDKTRQNSLLSTGPRSPEGKAIVSKNRTTHGLLSQQPPLLDTEDYATFEGIIQGLIEQYQPLGPLEHHLIQQIGMCILRQHRAWQAEAVAGDRHAAQNLLTQHYPKEKPGVAGGLESLVTTLATGSSDRRTPTHPDVLTVERRCLAALSNEVDLAWLDSPKSKAAFSKWCRLPVFEEEDNYTWACGHIAQVVADACKSYPDPARPSEHDHTHPLLIAAYLSQDCQQPPEAGELWLSEALYLRERSQTLCAAIAARLETIDQALTEIEHLTTLTKQSHSISEELELIGRYEARNGRQLKQATEQLQRLQAARQIPGGITLNGNKAPQLKVVANG